MAALDEATRRKIGQHLVLGFHGHDISEEVKVLITKYYVGNIILMKRNVRDAEQVRQLIRGLQSLAKTAGHERPLLIGIDQENGLVSAFSSPSAGTQFPGAMAQAAIGDVEMTRTIATACGRELKLVGINWTYSPVADVNLNPLNPVIGVRSFGSDPVLVSNHAKAAGEGFASAGVAPCAKHFPGHGDTHVDSHLALPVINKSKEQLLNADLPPFQALTGADVPSIMTAHVALPLLTGDNTPASLSRVITTDLLRDELHYDGVVVTDCLEMDAISAPDKGGCGIEEGAVRAIIAGADIAMICHTYKRQIGAIEQISIAVQNGKISLEDLERSGRRIVSMKEKFAGGWDEVLGQQNEVDFSDHWKALKNQNTQLSLEAYHRSATVIRDTGSLLPLKPPGDKKIALFTPLRELINKAVDGSSEGTARKKTDKVRNTAAPHDISFARALEKYGTVVHTVYGPNDTPQFTSSDIGSLILVTRNAYRTQWQWPVLRKVIKMVPEEVPVVLVASCDPYDFRLVDETLLQERIAFVSTYEFTSEAFVGASKLILG